MWDEWCNRVLANLQAFPEVVDARLRTELEGAVETAKSLVPVSSGKLRDSIRLEGGNLNYNFIADATNLRGQPYAVYLEMGTVKMPAQPFMVPALEQAFANFEVGIKEDARNLIGVRKVWKGMGEVIVVRESGRFVTWAKGG
jgi:HK97 gp10 family phage protein